MFTLDNGLLTDIKKTVSVQAQVRKLVAEHEKDIMELPIVDFVTVMQMLTPQSYGVKIQNKVIKQLGFKYINYTKNAGDCEDISGNKWEIKSSIINFSNPCLNLVQLRLWQDIKGYIVVVFDTRIEPMDIQVYRLDKNQMEQECILCGAASAHGTELANKDNKNVELRISIKIDTNDPVFNRWQDYRSSLDLFK